MPNHLITVIVPVFNVEPYLHQCLDSIVSQTYQNIEIILVDDGSPDHCGEICDEYAQKDTRIIVIHQENKGLSAARNVALDIAKGEYIMFVDSDDWVEPTFCEQALRMALEHQVEMVIFGYRYIFQNESIPRKANSSRIINKSEAIRHIILYDESSIVNAVWNKIYHRRVFQIIRFPTGMIYEDNAVMYRLLHLVSSAYVLDSVLYNYRKRENSLSGHSVRNSTKNLRHKFAVRNERLSFLKEHYPFPDLIEHQTLSLAKIAKNTMSRLNRNIPDEKRAFDLMSSFLKESKKNLLSIPCDKKTRIYLHSQTLYVIYMKLAGLKGKLYSLIKPHNRRIEDKDNIQIPKYFS